MSCPVVKPITPSIQHAEGPFWDEEVNVLYYVDTFTATVYRWPYCENNVTSFKLEGRDSVAVLIPIKDKPNEYIVGADRYLYTLSWNDNNRSTSPMLKDLMMIEENKPCNQYNDGKVDSKGRLWIGTLTRREDLSVEPNGGSLYMIKGGSWDFVEKLTCTSISNGLAWSGDSKHFYFIDSTTRTVVGYDFDEDTGSLGCKKVIFDLRDHPELKGIPDGMTIDENDNLWVALFGGQSVINVDPKNGSLIRTLKMPVTYVTSACFGGPQLDILYVTTSKLHLNEAQLKQEPLAGSVFAVSNLGVKGAASNKFSLNE